MGTAQHINGHNGHRPDLQTWGYPPDMQTLPALLTAVEDMRDNLDQIAVQARALIENAEKAVAFVDIRVEQARKRERRRVRRGTRKAIR